MYTGIFENFIFSCVNKSKHLPTKDNMLEVTLYKHF